MAPLSKANDKRKDGGIANMDIIAGLSLEIQRANAENVLQRLPREINLGVSDIRRCELSAIEVKGGKKKNSISQEGRKTMESTY